MPYLDQDFRDEIQREVDLNGLCSYLSSLCDDDFAGALNYLVFSIVRNRLEVNGAKYSRMASILGTITCCHKEIYRRLVAPYEDTKIEEHGDV